MKEMNKIIIIIIISNKNKRPVFKQLASGKGNLQNSLVHSWIISSSPKGTIESSIPKIHHASPVVNPRCVSPHEQPECINMQVRMTQRWAIHIIRGISQGSEWIRSSVISNRSGYLNVWFHPN